MLRTDQTVTAPLHGTVLAGTLRLGSIIELSADTTIVARSLVLSSRQVRISAHGHRLYVYPISTVSASAQPRPGRGASAAALVLAAHRQDHYSARRGFHGIITITQR